MTHVSSGQHNLHNNTYFYGKAVMASWRTLETGRRVLDKQDMLWGVGQGPVDTAEGAAGERWLGG